MHHPRQGAALRQRLERLARRDAGCILEPSPRRAGRDALRRWQAGRLAVGLGQPGQPHARGGASAPARLETPALAVIAGGAALDPLRRRRVFRV